MLLAWAAGSRAAANRVDCQLRAAPNLESGVWIHDLARSGVNIGMKLRVKPDRRSGRVFR
jgi:hypothetical protein